METRVTDNHLTPYDRARFHLTKAGHHLQLWFAAIEEGDTALAQFHRDDMLADIGLADEAFAEWRKVKETVTDA